MPKVSVIIPCYNQGEYLDETVASVLAQSYGDYEIVIVNDGSTDPFTTALLRDYRRPKTRVIHSENRGVSSARNSGIGEATGEYILPLDADDLIGRDYLRQAVGILDGPGTIGIVTCLIEFFDSMEFRPEQPPFSPETMTVRNALGPCSSFFRKTDWERVGGYNTNMTHGWEDWDFWLSLLERGLTVHRIPEVLFSYRIRNGSRERSLDTGKRVEMFMQLYKNHPDFYHENMRSVFSELCDYQDLLCSRSYRRMRYLANPGLLVAKAIDTLRKLAYSTPNPRRR
jgi:glycosyltransferase involved in cell wall biosynthesis